MLRATSGLGVDMLVGFVRRVGIFVGSLVAASLVMGLITWLVLIPMGTELRDSGAMPAVGALIGLLTIVLGGLIYRDIMEREERDG
jgi:peptidoglycan biosynthesis protein MviN/MurJ (putative lipid II flippase)